MRSLLFSFWTLLLFSSCDWSSDNSNPETKEENALTEFNSKLRIVEADAPNMEQDKIHKDGFVGNKFTYKRVFAEVFEDIEVPAFLLQVQVQNLLLKEMKTILD